MRRTGLFLFGLAFVLSLGCEPSRTCRRECRVSSDCDGLEVCLGDTGSSTGFACLPSRCRDCAGNCVVNDSSCSYVECR